MCAKECVACQENHKNPPKSLLHPWEIADEPWERIHLDFAGPYLGQMWFILIDACSKWPEVVSMTLPTADKTISVLRSIFARCGLPDNIVTDNGPKFTATKFKHFCDGNGIRHTLIASYHPSSNGQVERFVQTFKLSLQ